MEAAVAWERAFGFVRWVDPSEHTDLIRAVATLRAVEEREKPKARYEVRETPSRIFDNETGCFVSLEVIAERLNGGER